MKKSILAIAIFLSLFLSACSTTLPINYVPASSINGDGEISVGTIHYIPYEQGKVAENQFQQAEGSLGFIYLSDPVTDLIKTAVRKELIAGGFTVDDNSDFVIEADVTKFLYDWIGFVEVDFYLNINFQIRNKSGEVLFAHNTAAHQKAPKTMAQDTEAVRAAISKCIDEFFLEAHSKQWL
ncbi:YajG family lipoprotein [Desulfoluna butyratoxydans]|uniref:Lipoprotein n=1 Tax=Desulfoluna butyratoxydans TaxID=231438 RepID=A0A4U8YPS6_9BACT|nr:YajG family lipoprotein [Desulfoluna butyratoxydans]VFQ45801.1 uncharacterised protein family yajg [Desulfoluna butyratoxydans]